MYVCTRYDHNHTWSQVTVQDVEKARTLCKKFDFTFASTSGSAPVKENLLFEHVEGEKFIDALKNARAAFG